MEKAFITEINSRVKELEETHSKLTNYWMDGMFEGDTDGNIGRSLDFINKAIERLNKTI